MSESKQKAIELVKSFKQFVNPYMGSGMLSNTYDNDAILFQAKKCAHVCVVEIITSVPTVPFECDVHDNFIDKVDDAKGFWEQVVAGIDLVTVEDIFDDN